LNCSDHGRSVTAGQAINLKTAVGEAFEVKLKQDAAARLRAIRRIEQDVTIRAVPIAISALIL
jgi:hypothetical protein